MRSRGRGERRSGGHARWVVIAAVVAMVTVPAPPVGADREGATGLRLRSTVFLRDFPCPAASGEHPCRGSLAALLDGSLSGSGSEDRWAVTLSGASMSGAFVYGNPTLAPCAAGSFSGSFTIRAPVDAVPIGVYHDDAEPVPRSVTGVDASGEMKGEWVGAGMEIVLEDVAVTLEVDGVGEVEVVALGRGAATTTFRLELHAAEATNCVIPGETTLVTARLDGAAVLAEDHRPSTPVLLAPADGAEMPFGEPHRFRVNATDPDVDPYRAVVTVSDAATSEVVAGFETLPAPSGVDSTGTPDAPLPPGSYTWTATAVDVRGLEGPAALPVSFTVSPAGPQSDGTEVLGPDPVDAVP